MKSFFNTTHEAGQVLIDFESHASSQETMVIEVFQKTKVPMSWSEVKSFLPDMNEVSLKRSITVLMNKKVLVKTEQKVTGIYGKPNYRYKLI